VLKSYVDVKVARGKTKGQIDQKLELLEREVGASSMIVDEGS